jgi:hypothetical protein
MAYTPSVELLREVSGAELARIVGCSYERIVKELEQCPAAYRTDGGQWRVPLWAWQRWQDERGARPQP